MAPLVTFGLFYQYLCQGRQWMIHAFLPMYLVRPALTAHGRDNAWIRLHGFAPRGGRGGWPVHRRFGVNACRHDRHPHTAIQVRINRRPELDHGLRIDLFLDPVRGLVHFE